MSRFLSLILLCLAVHLTSTYAIPTQLPEAQSDNLDEDDNTTLPTQDYPDELPPSQTTPDTPTTSPQQDSSTLNKASAVRTGVSRLCQKRGKICIGGLLYYCNKKLRATPRNRRCDQPCYRHLDEYQHGKTYCRGLQSNNGVDCRAQTRGQRPPCICWSCNNSVLKYFYS